MYLSDETAIRKQTRNALAKRKIFTDKDLVETVPRKYRDYTRIKKLQECTPDTYNAVSGRLSNIEEKVAKTGRNYLSATIDEDGGTRFHVLFFAGVYLIKVYRKWIGSEVVVAGKVTKSPVFGYSVMNPDLMVPRAEFSPEIWKVYTSIGGVSDKTLRGLIHTYLEQQTEPLEAEVVKKDHLPEYRRSLYGLHYPRTAEDILKGQKRLLYDDMLYFAISVLKSESSASESPFRFDRLEKTRQFIGTLPYTLTKDQSAAISAMLANARAGKRNNVLLQGDVGCGKTIVAACMMMAAAENGYQSVLMAPRTVLAEQHYREISGYAERMGFSCVFLSSGDTPKEADRKRSLIASGEADFIVGTHSCLGSKVAYHSLGLVVTDEEHLFGVTQKEQLAEKAGMGVHCLSMSATPIPRTLTDVLYGAGREVISIKTKPAGRKAIKTSVTEKHDWVVMFMKQQIDMGHQCYVVCPAIDGEEDTGLTSVEDINRQYARYFKPYGIAVESVNGKMKPAEKEAVIGRFVRNECKVLVSTTVIEVGVNVPNATVMVVEQADRFGLASLHQLRGRIGRSDLQSYCFLVSEDTQNERLKIMEQTNDGFRIAEEDLKQRGSGNLIGTEQAGQNKYISEIITHPKMYECVKNTAAFCIRHGYGKELIARYAEHEAVC